jgi:hypothetical protein
MPRSCLLSDVDHRGQVGDGVNDLTHTGHLFSMVLRTILLLIQLSSLNKDFGSSVNLWVPTSGTPLSSVLR